ncbi:hypothetical protein V7S57_02230 [Caulobacter sp. CCNWLY153]|uniref:hypothetical protein n=1 Tax=unclassified Caulobacter TaxID=2648921 RepID=UPI002FF371C6
MTASSRTFVTRADVEAQARAAAEKAAKQVQSERYVLNLFADCVRDTKGLGVVLGWSCDEQGDPQPVFTMRLRDQAAATLLKELIYGGY